MGWSIWNRLTEQIKKYDLKQWIAVKNRLKLEQRKAICKKSERKSVHMNEWRKKELLSEWFNEWERFKRYSEVTHEVF